MIFHNFFYHGEIKKQIREPHYIDFMEEQSLAKDYYKKQRNKEKKPIFENSVLPHGFGRLIYLGPNGASLYEGLFENGKKH